MNIRAATETYRWLDLPIGKQSIPAWCRGLHVDWAEGYGNSPCVKLKTNCDPGEWPGQEWVYEAPDFWRSYSGDGRMLQHAHAGRLIWDDEKGAWLTTQDEGYGGRGFEILMKEDRDVLLVGKERSNRFDAWQDWRQQVTFRGDRRKVILRGPWHTSPKAGYIGVSFYDTSSPYHQREHFGAPNRWWRPWHGRTLCFGVFITIDLYCRLLAHFEPTLRLAEVSVGSITTLEPVKAIWDEPKRWMQMRARAGGLGS